MASSGIRSSLPSCTQARGALSGPFNGIPGHWLSDIVEYPRSVNWMEQLALNLGTNEQEQSLPGYCRLALPMRNLLFFAIVLFHGFRRLLPPY